MKKLNSIFFSFSKRGILSLCLFLYLFKIAFPQKYTISGFVEDNNTGERLIATTVYEANLKQGTTTNVYGFYSLTLPAGKTELIFSFVGYKPVILVFNLSKDTVINVKLIPSVTLSEVVITDQKIKQYENTQMSTVEIPISQVKSLPVLLGEKDVLKAIQLFPGVQSGSEGTSGIYVRGGGPDQNLILLDGVPVYNVDHLFGFFSVFNPDAIQHVSLIKGGFPARYGGRLSSVIDIRMKEGNNKEYQGEFSIGAISSKLTFEGPIVKNKSSFIVSARRTYLDVIMLPLIKAANNNASAGYYFYDFNAKMNYIVSNKDRLFLSFYSGNDKMYFGFKDAHSSEEHYNYTQQKGGLLWGNVTTALRWNHIVSKKMFTNITATYSKYNFKVYTKYNFKQYKDLYSYYFDYISGIHDWALKGDAEYHFSPSHKLLFGCSDIYHTFSPGATTFKATETANSINETLTFGNERIYAHEASAYIEDELSFRRLKLNSGLHLASFFVQSKNYTSLQPRLTATYILKENWSVKAAYSNMNQHILLLTNSGVGLPTDLWVPVTKNIKPQISTQYAAGIFHEMLKNYEVSLEGYYKLMDNLIEYKEGVDFFGIYSSWEEKVEIGKGKSYGGEFLIRKNSGKTTGWVGYTLSWTTRQFDNLNFGKPFPYKYDRRHDVGIAITHQFKTNIDFGVVWVYGTGNAISLPIEKYQAAVFNINENYYYQPTVLYYEGRNGFRAPAYHRLDLSLNIREEKKYGIQTWSFSVYNVYNRRNPFMITFSTDNQGNQRLKQISLFPLIPSVSYSLKFKTSQWFKKSSKDENN